MTLLEAICHGCNDTITASSTKQLICKEAQHYADSRIEIPKGAGRSFKVHTCIDFNETPQETQVKKMRIRSFAGYDWTLKTADGDTLENGQHNINPYRK